MKTSGLHLSADTASQNAHLPVGKLMRNFIDNKNIIINIIYNSNTITYNVMCDNSIMMSNIIRFSGVRIQWAVFVKMIPCYLNVQQSLGTTT